MAFAYNPPSLKDALEGRDSLKDDLDDLWSNKKVDAIEIIWYLRPIPGPDSAKKQQLAAYFRTERGRLYTSEERKEAYDALLGTDRNRRTHG